MRAKVAVIGGGSAGTMAALRVILNNDQCLFFPGNAQDKKASRALWVKKIENMPAHFSYKRGIEEPNAETIRWIQASAFAANLTLHKNSGIRTVKKLEDGGFELGDDKGAVHVCDYVLLCTGVMDVQPLIGGEIDPVFPFANAQIVDYCLRCDGHHIKGLETAVVGHSNAAAWVSIMLYERYRPPRMHLLAHGQTFEYDDKTRELMDMYGIERHAAKIVRFLGDEKKPELHGLELADGTVVQARTGFVSLGMLVYSDLAKQVGAEVDGRGFVITDATGLTKIPGFYAAGDVMAGTKKQIYTAWDTAVNAADHINLQIRSSARERELAIFRSKKS